MGTATAVAQRARKPERPVGLLGRPLPRIAPPVPVKHELAALTAVAESMGIRLMPWQESAARYLTATAPVMGAKRRSGPQTGAAAARLYREVAIVVARQNGKTALMKPHIIRSLRSGRRVLHLAQNRELPREMFAMIADTLSAEPELFPRRRGRVVWPRYSNGQEEIQLLNGGFYRIAASTRSGPRGLSVDDLLIDELREMTTWDALSAAEPTLTMSPDPQIVYLSNAGTDESVVLNALRARALSGEDPSLAYLEWSADPDRDADDRDGWAEANPALGHFPQVLRELERSYTARKADGQMGIFETERLCRWVSSFREALVDAQVWGSCSALELDRPHRPCMAVSMDPKGRRASAAISWRQADGTVALRMLFDVTGDPIDTDRLGAGLRDAARRHHVVSVGFDPMTDRALASFFPKVAQPITATHFANASSRFVAAVEARKVRWRDCSSVTADLVNTARKSNAERGTFEAVRAEDDRPITAALAAIRAVWLAGAVPRYRTRGIP